MTGKVMSTDIFMSSKAWPFEQAKQILRRLDIEKRSWL
jgi:lysyl-tRNA synthetase class 1